AFLAEDDAGNQGEVHAALGADQAEQPHIGEHHEIADDHRSQRPREAHAEYEQRTGHGAGDDHGKSEPHQGNRERAAARIRRHRLMLIFAAEEMIDLILGNMETIRYGGRLGYTTCHSATSFAQWDTIRE